MRLVSETMGDRRRMLRLSMREGIGKGVCCIKRRREEAFVSRPFKRELCSVQFRL